MKKFKIKPDEIVKLIEPIGAATATDMIMVEGKEIGYMYREQPINDVDTGWRFFAGMEDEEYIKNNTNTGFYDINTVANYDPAIIVHLNKPIGISLERIPGTNHFNIVKGEQ
jgi:hypothetical protein